MNAGGMGLVAITFSLLCCQSDRDKALAKTREVGPDVVCKDMKCFDVTEAECRATASSELEVCIKETPEPAEFDHDTARDWARKIGKCTARRVILAMHERGKWICPLTMPDAGP